MPRLGPGIGEHQKQPIQSGFRQSAQQMPRILRPKPEITRQRAGRLRLFRHQAREQSAKPVLEYFRGNIGNLRMRRDLIERVFPASEAHFQPDRHITPAEGGARISRLSLGQAQPRQGFFQQALLARAQGVSSAPTIKAVWHTISQWGSVSGHAQS